MTERIRFALLTLALLAFGAARATGALASTTIHAHTHRVHHKVTHATAVAHMQAKVVKFARHYLGVRYVYGGTSPSTGFDCSGFTRFVYGHFGITLPHFSGAQFDLGRRIARTGLRPGDLVFFDGVGHVGIYVGSGKFIHAPQTGERVSITSLAGWNYDGARRLISK